MVWPRFSTALMDPVNFKSLRCRVYFRRPEEIILMGDWAVPSFILDKPYPCSNSVKASGDSAFTMFPALTKFCITSFAALSFCLVSICRLSAFFDSASCFELQEKINCEHNIEIKIEFFISASWVGLSIYLEQS